MPAAFTRLLLAALTLGLLAALLVIGVWYASRRAGALGASAAWLGASLVFTAYMIWRTYQAAASVGARPAIAALSASLYVALGLSLAAFAPAAWYMWREQRRGTVTLSQALVLRGVGVFFLGCVGLVLLAFLLDLLRLGSA